MKIEEPLDPPPDHPAGSREERVNAVLTAYLHGLDTGNSTEPAELIAQYPDLQPELSHFLADHARWDNLTRPLRMAAAWTPDSQAAGDDTVFDDRLGLQVGDYELVREIGRGGMGVVYEARQQSLGRHVALKIVRASRLDSATSLRRFRNEAEAVAALDHPHIVPVYEVGEWREDPESAPFLYFSMKWIRGKNLAQRLSEFARDPRSAARVVTAIAQAVHHAHERGILHRDLKPSNILIDEDGQPFVADFGLAKRLAAASHLTHTGDHVGTPSYMAPEQAGASPAAVTVAADIYGLGGILYALLAGRPPFVADSPFATLLQLKECEPERPRFHNPRVDRDLETICLKCLEKEPGKRYASAQAVARDLEHYLSGRPIAARPVGRAERIRRWCGRNPVVAALGVFLTVASLALAGTALLLLEQRNEASAQRSLAEARAESIRLEKYVSDMSFAHSALRTGKLAEADQLLAPYAAPAEGKDHRGFEWYYLWRLVHADQCMHDPYPLRQQFPAHRGGAFHVVYSPDGKQLATCGADGTARVWNAATGKELACLRGHHPGEVNYVAFSPDGGRIATAGDDGRVRLWDWRQCKEEIRLPAEKGEVHVVEFSPDGQYLATGGDDAVIRMWNVKTGQLHRQLTGHEGRIDALSFSGHDSLLVSIGRKLNAKVWDADTWKQKFGLKLLEGTGPTAFSAGITFLRETGCFVTCSAFDGFGRMDLWDSTTGRRRRSSIHPIQEFARSPAASPDGALLATPGLDGSLGLWDVATLTPLARWPAHAKRTHSAAFSPDGKTLASAGADGTIRLWQVVSNESQRFLPDRQNFSDIALSPDERTLACLSNHERLIRFFDTDRWQPRGGTIQAPDRDQFVCPNWSPDGGHIGTVCSGGGPITIWDLNGNPIGPKLEHNAWGCLAFSPDGRYVAMGTIETVRLWSMENGHLLRNLTGLMAVFSGRLLRPTVERF